MKLTESDPALALRGYIIGRTGILPTDPRFRKLNGLSLTYTYHWLKKSEEDFWERLNHILGTSWTKEDVQALNSKKDGSGGAPDKIFIPLSLLLNPDIAKGLQKAFGKSGSRVIADGEYIPGKGEEIVEMGDWDKEAFLSSLKGAGIAGIPSKIDAPRVPKMDIPNDPATMSRMKQEIEKGRKK